MSHTLTIELSDGGKEALEETAKKSGWSLRDVVRYGLQMAAKKNHDVNSDFKFAEEKNIISAILTSPEPPPAEPEPPAPAPSE